MITIVGVLIVQRVFPAAGNDVKQIGADRRLEVGRGDHDDGVYPPI